MVSHTSAFGTSETSGPEDERDGPLGFQDRLSPEAGKAGFLTRGCNSLFCGFTDSHLEAAFVEQHSELLRRRGRMLGFVAFVYMGSWYLDFRGLSLGTLAKALYTALIILPVLTGLLTLRPVWRRFTPEGAEALLIFLMTGFTGLVSVIFDEYRTPLFLGLESLSSTALGSSSDGQDCGCGAMLRRCSAESCSLDVRMPDLLYFSDSTGLFRLVVMVNACSLVVPVRAARLWPVALAPLITLFVGIVIYGTPVGPEKLGLQNILAAIVLLALTLWGHRSAEGDRRRLFAQVREVNRQKAQIGELLEERLALEHQRAPPPRGGRTTEPVVRLGSNTGESPTEGGDEVARANHSSGCDDDPMWQEKTQVSSSSARPAAISSQASTFSLTLTTLTTGSQGGHLKQAGSIGGSSSVATVQRAIGKRGKSKEDRSDIGEHEALAHWGEEVVDVPVPNEGSIWEPMSHTEASASNTEERVAPRADPGQTWRHSGGERSKLVELPKVDAEARGDHAASSSIAPASLSALPVNDPPSPKWSEDSAAGESGGCGGNPCPSTSSISSDMPATVSDSCVLAAEDGGGASSGSAGDGQDNVYWRPAGRPPRLPGKLKCRSRKVQTELQLDEVTWADILLRMELLDTKTEDGFPD